MTYIVLVSRAVLVGVFLVSLVSKVWRRAAFTEFVLSVAALRVLPRRWARPTAWGAVTGEAFAVVLLVVPATVPLGFGCAAILLLVFTGAIVWAVRRGDRASCRCFGASTTPLGLPHVIRNVVLLGLCAAGVVASVVTTNVVLRPGGLAVAMAGAAVAVLIVVRLDDLLGLFAAPDPSLGSTHSIK